VAPLKGLAKDVRYEGHFLCHPKSGERRQLVKRLSEWLERELSQDISL